VNQCEAKRCPANQVYKTLGCPDNTCTNPKRYAATGGVCKPEVMRKGCYCKPGFLLNEKTGNCVNPKKCPPPRKTTTTTTTTLPPCTQVEKDTCDNDCWIEKSRSIGCCDTSCSCETCTDNSDCADRCVNLDGATNGVCSFGDCKCSYNCASGRFDGGYCPACCSDSCKSRGFNGGECNYENTCICSKYTQETCNNFCASTNSTDGLLCSDVTCKCQACNRAKCTEHCLKQSGMVNGTCAGQQGSCLCVPSLELNSQSRNCASKFCTDLAWLWGYTMDCTNHPDQCYTNDGICVDTHCDEICKLRNSLGNGTCTSSTTIPGRECKCSLTQKELQKCAS
jgi:hypothetical protein